MRLIKAECGRCGSAGIAKPGFFIDVDIVSKFGHSVEVNARNRRRRKIITATLGLIEARGLAAVSLSDIATAADVSRQTVYNHFSDTGAVIEAALDLHGTAMRAHFVGLMDEVDTPREKVAALARFMIEAADPAHDALSLEAALPAEARARMERHTNDLRALIAKVLSPQDATRADLVWSMIEGASHSAARHPDQKDKLLSLLTKALNAIL